MRMICFQQMNHFMHQDIFKTFNWLFASCRLIHMRFLSMLHVPHLVFMFLMRYSLALRFMRFSTIGIKLCRTLFNSLRYHSLNTFSLFAVLAPLGTENNILFGIFSILYFLVPTATSRRYGLPHK